MMLCWLQGILICGITCKYAPGAQGGGVGNQLQVADGVHPPNQGGLAILL